MKELNGKMDIYDRGFGPIYEEPTICGEDAEVSEFTYYTSAKGCLKDCSLSIEMMHPDSTYQMNIETFSIIWKPMEI